MNDENDQPTTRDATGTDPGGEPRPSTGDARVDEAVGRLEGIESLDVDEHPALYDEVHQALGRVLDGRSGHDQAERSGHDQAES